MNFEVITVGSRKEFQSKFGPMVSYTLTVKGPEGFPMEVELNQKLDTAAPYEGQVIYGHIEESQYGHKLKKDPPVEQAPAKASTAPQASAPAPSYRQQDPEIQVSIQRQNALTNATNRAIALAGLLERRDEVDKAIEALKPSSIAMAAYWFARYSGGDWNPLDTVSKKDEDEPEDEVAFDELPKE